MGLGTCAVLLGGITALYASTAVLLIGSAMAAWAFLIVLLGLGRPHLSFTTPTLRYLAEAALPISLLHQAAIVIPGFWLVQLPLGIATKFVLLLAAAYAITFAAYHFLLRPPQPPRILFGIRPLASLLRPVRAVVAGTAAAALLVFATADPSPAAVSPLELWYAEGGAAQVAIEPCGDALCGRVVWLRSPYDENGCTTSDRYHPDASLSGRSLVGFRFLDGLTPVAEGTWDGGTFYDPTSGRTYCCETTRDATAAAAHRPG